MQNIFYPNLIKAMEKEHVTKTDLATLIGVHFNTITDKLEGNTTSEKKIYNIGFTLLEAFVIKKVLFKSYDFSWLFECQAESNNIATA